VQRTKLFKRDSILDSVLQKETRAIQESRENIKLLEELRFMLVQLGKMSEVKARNLSTK